MTITTRNQEIVYKVTLFENGIGSSDPGYLK